MEYYSAIKNEILPFAATWMDLENIILSQTEKDKYFMISHMWNLKNHTNESLHKIETGTSLVVQWLRLHAPNAGGPGFDPWSGN